MSARPWPQARSDELVVRELDGELLVYDRHRHQGHCLSPATAAAWRECDGRSSPSRIAGRLRRRGFQADEAVVRTALAQLARARLLSGALPVAAPDAASRRQWIRKASLAGFALLSINAPTAAQAATCISHANCEVIPQNRSCPGVPCCDVPGKTCRKEGGGNKCNCF